MKHIYVLKRVVCCALFSFVYSVYGNHQLAKEVCNYQQIPGVKVLCEPCEYRFDTLYFERTPYAYYTDKDFRRESIDYGGTLNRPFLDGR